MRFPPPDEKAAAFCLSVAAILMATDVAVAHHWIIFVPLAVALGLTGVRWLGMLTDDIDRSRPYAHLHRIDTGRWLLAHASGFATYLMVALTVGLLLLGSRAPQDP